LPDGIFLNRNPNLGKFWRVLQWKMLLYFKAVWYIYCYLVYFTVVWYISSLLVRFTKTNLATLRANCLQTQMVER
jgi:hypothetical protein